MADYFSSYNLSPQQTANNERKLNDLTSRAESLDAMNWDQFQRTHQIEPTTRSRIGTGLGLLIGGIGGVVTGGLVGYYADTSILPTLGGGVLGGGAGALIGGNFSTDLDRRTATIDAYEKYLNGLTANRSPQQAQAMEQNAPSIPFSQRVRSSETGLTR